MTNPPPPVTHSSHATVPLEPVAFPLSWLLDNASAPIRYRSLLEVARLEIQGEKLLALPLSYKPALELALLQGRDGVWHGSMLALPSARGGSFRGVGTIPAVRRLLEYGWERESPPLLQSRRLLFRLLAEDDDPAWLFELGRGKMSLEMVQRGRGLLREAAAAALAQAGYEGDPRLRGAAQRILDRVVGYLRSPLAEKPWIRVGNKHVLAAEASPPSFYTLLMLAYMPLFRSERFSQVEYLFQHLTRPLPRQAAQQLVGDKIVEQPHLVLGDMLPHRNAADADVPFALFWLELMARLQFLRRHEGWLALYERFLADRDNDFVWHPHKGMAMPRSNNPAVWPYFPLESSPTGEERWTDVTFRLGLIARLMGRPIELV